MERSVDSRLEALKTHLLSMGGAVEKSLDIVIDGLTHRKTQGLQEVHKLEEVINEMHVKVDNLCLEFLAIQGPVAKDLRLIISLIKINADLERMGDQCVNIAHTGRDYLSRNPIPIPPEIAEMGQIVKKMVKSSLDSFVREDVEMSKKILLMDDEVDIRKQKVFQDVSELIKKSPQNVEASLDMILIARNLERLGDHATNIAEGVIFYSTGKDVRHGGKYS